MHLSDNLKEDFWLIRIEIHTEHEEFILVRGKLPSPSNPDQKIRHSFSDLASKFHIHLATFELAMVEGTINSASLPK